MQTLDDLFGGHFMSEVADPYSVYARLRRDEPVKLLDLPMQPGYVVTRYEHVVAVLRNAALFSSRANAKGIGLVMGKTILEMDGAEHARHRNLISLAFVPKALKGDLPARIAALANAMIDQFVADGTADLVAQFTRTFPLRVIAQLIGVPIADYETFKRWSLDIIGFGDDPVRGFESAQKLVDFLRPVLEARRNAPCGDLMSTLAHAVVDGHRLEDEEIFSFLRLLLPAGSDTTFRLIGSTLYALLTHREQLAEVLADRNKIAAAIEETLRWESPVQFASRETTTATTLGGVDLPEGAQILTALGSANRDDKRFAQPDRFDLHRRIEEHMAFGFGRHFCVGSHLARLEATTALSALLDRLPNLRFDPQKSTGVVGLAFRSPRSLPVVFDAPR
ncbi:MAG: cytochrome P450 [Deltaproteobacteria bacterium]|nr:cytochrome P450 [Deltaproteobacteria bacterium]